MTQSGFTRASPTLLRRSVKPLAKSAYVIAPRVKSASSKPFSHCEELSYANGIANSTQMNPVEFSISTEAPNGLVSGGGA